MHVLCARSPVSRSCGSPAGHSRGAACSYVWSTGAPHEGRVLVCGAAMLHTRLVGGLLRIVWSNIAPHNVQWEGKAKVWRAVSPHKTHTGISAGVWSIIAPHKLRTPVRNRCVEHWRSTHISHVLVWSIVASHKRLPRTRHPNVWSVIAPHMMVKYGFPTLNWNGPLYPS